MPDERSLLDELDEAERVMRECGARHDDLTAIYCHRAADHDGPHEGHSVVTWGDVDDFPPRCDDPNCDGDLGHDGPHFAWVPE